MASTYNSRGEWLGELVSAASVKGTPAQAVTLVKTDIARQAALADKNKWRTAAMILSGVVVFLAVKRWR